MLKNNLNYIAFDFETTGLDWKKDDAIQIGIVKFNHKYEILEQFSSYIKPDNLQNLSEIVEFTTWIKKEQLETAPSFDEIKEKIIPFFDENSVLIGHNIKFDIDFLQKYIWNIPHKYVFDTYVYARKFLHFEPAYALEILADKYWFKGQSHDALADSIMAMELFKLIMKKIEKIIKKYPFLADLILKSDSLLKEILVLNPVNRNIFSIPKKWKNIAKVKKIKSNLPSLNDFENKSVFSTLWINIQQAINFALNWQNKVILAFSSNARANVAKSILKDKYLPFSVLNNGFTISEENEKKLLEKKELKDFEMDFILKSFTHYDEDISVFDVANFDEYKVFKFVSDKQRKISSNFVVCTHYELFQYIKNNGKNDLKDFSIVFFDGQSVLNSLWSVINKGFDFYELINKLEVLKYEKSFSENIEKYENLINEVSTFFGLFAVNIKNLFKNTNNKIEMVNMFEDTQTGLKQMKEWFYELENKLKSLENEEISKTWDIFKECVEHYCIIEQKLFWNWQLKYVFHPLMENIDINTFNDFLDGLKYFNFSWLENKNYLKLKDVLKIEENLDISKFVDWNDNIDFKLLVEKIKNKIEAGISLFLVSNNKNFSNSLFKLIFNLLKEYDLKANIYAENITWWQGKLLYYIKKDHWPKITIGGPEFLIQNKAKYINYNEIHFLAIGGKNRKNTINDLYFYLA